MLENIKLTRKGWIKHLSMVQVAVSLVEALQLNVEMSFPGAECEKERAKKIGQAMVKLQELIWESGAVSERIHRERGKDDPDFDTLERDFCDQAAERKLERFRTAARKLEELAHMLADEDVIVTPVMDPVYPGPIDKTEPDGDPNQILLGLRPSEPTQIDYKELAANDDTHRQETDEDDEE